MSVKIIAIVLVALGVAQANPLHASCKIQWEFPSVSCADFASKVTQQATAWETADNCNNGGEKCLYKITSQSDTEIKGTHTTPVKSYVDDISFKLTTAGNGCNVEGFSTSQTWYAYLDYGTNYCNLNNLITGSQLDKSSGYKETTSEDVCTQYNSADCEKY